MCGSKAKQEDQIGGMLVTMEMCCSALLLQGVQLTNGPRCPLSGFTTAFMFMPRSRFPCMWGPLVQAHPWRVWDSSMWDFGSAAPQQPGWDCLTAALQSEALPVYPASFLISFPRCQPCVTVWGSLCPSTHSLQIIPHKHFPKKSLAIWSQSVCFSEGPNWHRGPLP